MEAAEETESEYDEALDPENGEETFEVDFDPSLEERDIHEADEELAQGDASEAEGPEVKAKSIRAIQGMGKIFDYRGTGLCPPNGGLIRPLLMVHHIPVVRNMKGSADLVVLGRVLRGQGLAIQAATDAEGNVALYTRFNQLCFGQRGANQFSCGVEHMHLNVGEDWTEKQMRAAAWCANQVFVSHGIPLHRAILTPGSRQCGVQRRGHTSHENVSKKAGFNDRSDPGDGFNYVHMYELARHFNKRHKF